MAAGASLRVQADLALRVETTGRGGGPPTLTTGRLRAAGTDLVVELSRTPSLTGRGTRPVVAPFAARLAEQGLTVHLNGPDGPLVRLGAGVRAPFWQRPATGSALVEVVALRALRHSLGGPPLFSAALPTLVVLPQFTRAQRSPARQARLALRARLRRLTGLRRG